jgi:hypothetical protein
MNMYSRSNYFKCSSFGFTKYNLSQRTKGLGRPFFFRGIHLKSNETESLFVMKFMI